MKYCKMRVTILLSAFFMAVLTGTAQQAPDNDLVLKAIIDSQSPYYYPALMLRYEAGDTTLTVDEYRYLYYGYAFQPEYKPLEPIQGETSILNVIDRFKETEMPTSQEAGEIIMYGKEVMKSDPFSPRNLNFMTFAYSILGDTVNAKVFADKRLKVLKTIESSGTGLKESSPWHILWFTHANDFLASRGMDVAKRTVRTRSVEYIQPVNRVETSKGYFFDFGRIYWKKPENTQREKRVSGFEINGIKVGEKKGRYNPPK